MSVQDEDERHLRQPDAQTLELGDRYFDDFYSNFASEYSIPEPLVESILSMREEAKAKSPSLTPHQFAQENARSIFEYVVFFD